MFGDPVRKNFIEVVIDLVFKVFRPRPITMPRSNVPPDTRCCERNELSSRKECKLCGRPICLRCRRLFNGDWICTQCRDHVKAIVDRERGETRHIPGALIGGILAGAATSYALTCIAMITGLVCYVPVGILAGLGAFLGAGFRRGGYIQLAGMFCATVSVLMTSYFTFVSVVQEKFDPNGALGLNAWDTRVFSAFTNALLSAEGLFLFIAILFSAGISIAIPQPRIAAVR